MTVPNARPPIKPHRFRQDWFEVELALGHTIADVPGVALASKRDCYEVHRTHLPLLGEQGSGVLAEHHKPLWSPEERAARLPEGLIFREHQQTALDFLEPRTGVLLADGMRLGKTLTALCAHDAKRGPLVILAPLSTRHVWLEWIERLWPGAKVVLMLGTHAEPGAFAGADVVFGHHDILTHFKLTSLRPGTLIVDEAHLFSNPKALRTKALHFFASASARVILLTGTPLWNKSQGLWSVLAATNPGAWGRSFAFAQRYCAPVLGEYGWRYDGVSNEVEWFARRDEVLIARQWPDVAKNLPPIQYNIETVDLDSEELRKLDMIAFEIRKNPEGNALEDMNYYRQATGLYKAPPTADLARRFLQGGEDVVIWTWHKRVGTVIAKELAKGKDGFRAFIVNGDDSIEMRDTTIAAWKASPTAAPLIISIAVGQVGIDLSRAHHTIFAEVDWIPAVVAQALMRTFDIRRPMTVTFLMLAHEADQRLINLLREKLERGEALGFTAAGAMFRLPEAQAAADEDLLAAFSAAISG